LDGAGKSDSEGVYKSSPRNRSPRKPTPIKGSPALRQSLGDKPPTNSYIGGETSAIKGDESQYFSDEKETIKIVENLNLSSGGKGDTSTL